MEPRKRIGMLVPAVNTTLETEFQLALASDYSLHVARFLSTDPVTGTKIYAKPGLNETLRHGLDQVMAVEPEVVALGCTTATFLHGVRYDSDIRSEATQYLGLPFVTAAGSVISALQRRNVEKVALLSPYESTAEDRVIKFLNEAGVEVVATSNLTGLSSMEKGRLSPWEPLRLFQKSDITGADAVFLSCTNWRTLEATSVIEEICGIPTISSNTALFERIKEVTEIPLPV